MKLIIFISYINLKRNLKKKYKKKKMISNITHSPCLKTEHEELVENRWTTSSFEGFQSYLYWIILEMK